MIKVIVWWSGERAPSSSMIGRSGNASWARTAAKRAASRSPRVAGAKPNFYFHTAVQRALLTCSTRGPLTVLQYISGYRKGTLNENKYIYNIYIYTYSMMVQQGTV